MKSRYPASNLIRASRPENSRSPFILGDIKQRHGLVVLLLFLLSPDVYTQGIAKGTGNQDSYIVDAVVYTKGVYRTFDEFKHNKPSITDHYIIEKGKIWRTYDSGDKNEIKKKEIWGYCTGDKIFIRRASYNQILELGRYCYFKDQGKSQLYGTHENNLMFGSYKERMIVDFNTGRITRLTTNSMKQILEADDPDLLAEFNANPDSGKKLYQFLMKYNQRNKSKIR
jgi:hypothetical protein